MNENEPNILDMDLSTIQTDMPLVKGGLYDMTVHEVSVDENKKKDGENLNITFTNTVAVTSTKDETLPPGTARVYHTISLKTSQKATAEAVARRVAQFIQACTPAVAGIRMANLKETIVATKGKVVRVKVDVESERKDKETGNTYPERNSIASFVKI